MDRDNHYDEKNMPWSHDKAWTKATTKELKVKRRPSLAEVLSLVMGTLIVCTALSIVVALLLEVF